VINRIAILLLLGFSISACSSNSSPTNPTTTGTPVSMTVGSSTKTTDAYSPNPITVARGGAITWTNNDTTAHTSTSDNGTWNSGSLAPGQSFTFTFSNSGSFTYHCTLHPGMVGTVTVQ